MEEHKWRYLYAFLSLEHAKPLEDYVTALRELEHRARDCYAETIKLSSDEFVKMMLLNGCFIIVFLLRYMFPKHRDHGRDPIFDTMWMFDALRIDMILLENQLPFFVLECLDYRTAYAARPSLLELTTFYFDNLVKMDEIPKNHYMLSPPSESYPSIQNGGEKKQQPLNQQRVPGNQNGTLACQICGRFGHSALRCSNRYNHAYQAEDMPQAMAAMNIDDPQDPELIPDTGASSHMTNDPGIFTALKPYKGDDKIIVGNGQALEISHVGSATIPIGSKKIMLDNVLLVPKIARNLLSVSQMIDDNSCIFEFSSTGFVIKDQKTGRILVRGSRDGSLHSFGAERRALFSIRSRKVTEGVWHQRLGHPYSKIVRLLITVFKQWNDPDIATSDSSTLIGQPESPAPRGDVH
ncbi:hypothetical protein HHK36_025754 [Tetracentron sinense]|uniref:Retrovirus-related Pol polyprotein from transposon TNT 1-94-like beta-barrel domain-containing protein n=1 Tax=Tetracentron sinense TaxID=13715 RepID=A0A834YHG9_TETSI|nr:hypothetical protein HHK36_025754 [Tetracentron sinense]